MLLLRAPKDISQPGQAYKMGILGKIVNVLKSILKLIWWILTVYFFLDTWISDTSDPTGLSTKETICFVPFNHLGHDPLDPG